MAEPLPPLRLLTDDQLRRTPHEASDDLRGPVCRSVIDAYDAATYGLRSRLISDLLDDQLLIVGGTITSMIGNSAWSQSRAGKEIYGRGSDHRKEQRSFSSLTLKIRFCKERSLQRGRVRPGPRGSARRSAPCLRSYIAVQPGSRGASALRPLIPCSRRPAQTRSVRNWDMSWEFRKRGAGELSDRLLTEAW